VILGGAGWRASGRRAAIEQTFEGEEPEAAHVASAQTK